MLDKLGRMGVKNARYDRSFHGLEDGNLVEFYPIGHDPNSDDVMLPLYGGLVQVIGEPRLGENNRLFVSVRVKDDFQNPRVFADTNAPWNVSGGQQAGLGFLFD